MTSTIVESFLTRNLECFGERNALLARQIASAPPRLDVEFAETEDGAPAAILDGRAMCSRRRPLAEADRLIESVDIVEHAAVVVLGFGAGHHIRRLAERLGRSGIIIVFEPDLSLLRTVLERIDHSWWMRDALIAWVTDPSDRGELARQLDGAESILAQGVTFLGHPASRARLGERSTVFAESLSAHVNAAKTTLLTTLMRSIDTIRNYLLNLDHYAAGPGIIDLENATKGYPAVIVSAGPSLRKNIHQLAQPGVRDRCVIVAVQTTVKPLLDAGVRPHFVTALDYHEISRRFHEGLRAEDVGDATLIADPKAHPVILDRYPGPVRCCQAPFLDMVLGDLAKPMGDLPSGATVAHLALYVARYLGCNRIAFIGQDLGFTDGLYYTPGTATHDVWAPELNPFNTVEMMEWQRIVRHRVHLRKVRDVYGRSIYTDAQMTTYQHQFERDFAAMKREGVEIIDASEGGVAKQHTKVMPLAEMLERYATRPLPALPTAQPKDDSKLPLVSERLTVLRHDIATLRQVSLKTSTLIRRMLDDQDNEQKLERHFRKLQTYREEVEQRLDSLQILNQLNQLGVFKRFKADRKLHVQTDLTPTERQRAQLERDLQNVIWIADAAGEFEGQLDAAQRLVRGEATEASTDAGTSLLSDEMLASTPSRIAALIPIDPTRNGLGVERSLTEDLCGRSVLQATLERVGRSKKVELIVLIMPSGFDVEPLIDRDRIALPIEIERCHGDSPFGVEHLAIAAARSWSTRCWRGGIAGVSIYDEILCPIVMRDIMERRDLTAALLVGPDWPLVDVSAASGCDAVIDRHLQFPEHHNLVFTQAPPGLCGCVVSLQLMTELAARTRLSTVGGLLTYQPHAPQHDPIARKLNVQIDHEVSQSLVRATFDTQRQRHTMRRALEGCDPTTLDAVHAVRAISEVDESDEGLLPSQMVLELTCQRQSTGLFARSRSSSNRRTPIEPARARTILEHAAPLGDCVLTLDGAGDPLEHEAFDEIIRIANDCGFCAVNIRTELLAERDVLDRLLACSVDVVSVDLNANSAQTYQVMMGADRFDEVIANLQYLADHRRRLTDHPGTAALALPWLVPHLQRCLETYEDIEGFFDRWQGCLGTAVIEGAPAFAIKQESDSPPFTHAVTPPQTVRAERRRTMTILCDGAIAPDPGDYRGATSVEFGSIESLIDVWRTAVSEAQTQRGGSSS